MLMYQYALHMLVLHGYMTNACLNTCTRTCMHTHTQILCSQTGLFFLLFLPVLVVLCLDSALSWALVHSVLMLAPLSRMELSTNICLLLMLLFFLKVVTQN